MSRTTVATPRRAKAQRKAQVPRALYVISDSTGNLARHMLGALLTQFPAEAVAIRVEPFVRSQSRLKELLHRAKAENAAVCHAMVSLEFKEAIAGFCTRGKLPCRDLTGGMMEFLSEVTGVGPNRDIAALHRLDDAYNRRIGAMEYTLAHDDGLGAATLREADVVLAGVSRTSKTPTSIYLAQQGYRVANVALAMEVEPPAQLLKMPRGKVVGLLINPHQLSTIRTHREQGWGSKAGNYGEPDHVVRELAWSWGLFNDHGWKSLDVTDQAIEETAARIIGMVGLPDHPCGSGTLSGQEFL